MLKNKNIVAAAAFALAFGANQVYAEPIPVALELALLVDVSGSVDGNEYILQKTGYINAFKDAQVQSAIAGLTGGIAVTYVEWSAGTQQAQLVGWTHITDAISADNFADAIGATTRAFSGQTAPGSAINFITPQFSTNSFEGERWVIDVSGDGTQNSGANTALARDDFLTNVPGGVVGTINGISIESLAVHEWYKNNVMVGANAFTVHAATFGDFENAIKTKLVREITGKVPEPASLLLIGLGLAGLTVIRRRKLTA